MSDLRLHLGWEETGILIDRCELALKKHWLAPNVRQAYMTILRGLRQLHLATGTNLIKIMNEKEQCACGHDNEAHSFDACETGEEPAPCGQCKCEDFRVGNA